eukprot:SAG31_NODE_18784_length_622_cov_4.971319_2_plen_173_part_00
MARIALMVNFGSWRRSIQLGRSISKWILSGYTFVTANGPASSPALYVEAMTNVLNEYGICAGSRSTGLNKLTAKGKLMHEIFSRDNTAPEFKGTEFEKYGDWSYHKDEQSTAEDQYCWCLSYIDDTVCLNMDLRQAERRAHMLCYVCTESGYWMNPAKCNVTRRVVAARWRH